jgi:PhnB protein
MTWAQAYGTTDPTQTDMIAWGQVQSEDGFHLMAYDVPLDRAWNPGRRHCSLRSMEPTPPR